MWQAARNVKIFLNLQADAAVEDLGVGEDGTRNHWQLQTTQFGLVRPAATAQINRTHAPSRLGW